MGLKQRCNIVLIGIMKAVEGLAIFGLICGATSLPTYAQVVTATVTNVYDPISVAVDPVTNKIYVANSLVNIYAPDGTVTVIDGATNNTTTVDAGVEPYAVAVNPNTNQIYVANRTQCELSVLSQ